MLPICLKFPVIEIRPNKNEGTKFICEHTFSELTALCPETRLPDFYTVKIEYEPEKKLVELKSLKYYFSAFRSVEILHEEITNKIMNDLIRVVEPRWIVITVVVNVRGGINTTITRKWKAAPENDGSRIEQEERSQIDED